MTRDEIIRMAEQAGFGAGAGQVWAEHREGICTSEVERLVALAYAAGAAEERERRTVIDWGQHKYGTGVEVDPLNGLRKEQAREWFNEVSKPMQQWPSPNWQYGCRVCNNGAQVGALGYVCPRSDCPTKITCGGVVSMCVGCEGKPTLQNSPCAVCGKIAQQEQGPVAWRYKGMMGMPWSLSDDGYYASCKRDNGYTVEPLYTHPAEPEPPPEPIHEDKIRHRYQELAQYCEPGDMLDDDWFEAGVRWAEAHHEIV
jgi:hypothetical protein